MSRALLFTPRWRYRLYELGAYTLAWPVVVFIWLQHRWSLLMLQGVELEEYWRAFRRARAAVQQ